MSESRSNDASIIALWALQSFAAADLLRRHDKAFLGDALDASTSDVLDIWGDSIGRDLLKSEIEALNAKADADGLNEDQLFSKGGKFLVN